MIYTRFNSTKICYRCNITKELFEFRFKNITDNYLNIKLACNACINKQIDSNRVKALENENLELSFLKDEDKFKVCHTCTRKLHFNEFVKNKKYKYGIASLCKQCRKAKALIYVKKTKNRINMLAKQRRSHPVGKQKYSFKQLKDRYKLSENEYINLYQLQNGVCAICKNPPADFQFKKLVVDHISKSKPPIVRGLLCVFCNLALGAAKDNIETIKNLINYISNYNEQTLYMCWYCRNNYNINLFNLDKFNTRSYLSKCCLNCQQNNEKELKTYYNSLNDTEKTKLGKYGITPEIFNSMLSAQNNICLGCKCIFEANDKIHIDHNHTTNNVRGLLCHACNSFLGSIKENKIYMQNCIKYLERYL